MIHFRCPQCEQPVEAVPAAAGRRVQCLGCGALVAVPGEPPPAPATGALLTRRQLSRQIFGTFAFLIPLALVALGVGGYKAYQRWFAANVWIYVDNTGDRPVTVRLDGVVKATVAPGTFAVVKCREGSLHINVKRETETLFDETKELSASKDEKPSKYLLNPEAAGRYHTHSVQYGVAFMPWGLNNLRQPVERFRPLIANDANLFPAMNEDAIKNELFWACSHAGVKLLEPTVWQDISQFDVVLERAPRQIEGNITGKQEVFARLSKADYDAITMIQSNQQMTKPELANAVRAMEHILDAELPR